MSTDMTLIVLAASCLALGLGQLMHALWHRRRGDQ